MFPVMIALIAFAGLRVVFGLVAFVSRQRASNINAFFKPAVFIPADVALVRAGIDQLSLGHVCLPSVIAQGERMRFQKDACVVRTYGIRVRIRLTPD